MKEVIEMREASAKSLETWKGGGGRLVGVRCGGGGCGFGYDVGGGVIVVVEGYGGAEREGRGGQISVSGVRDEARMLACTIPIMQR